jgi:alkanesulfonate monooxygenase SsuD/methylene tetrahydromethanopterin reductase-like flavin-dependent oxidoreductase (luciferase family)
VQRPHIPLWIGGGGERVTLRLVAQFGDACNVGGDPANVRHKLEVLKRHCDDVGRDYDEIVKSTSVEPVVLLEPGADPERATAHLRGELSLAEYRRRTWVGTPEEIAERVRAVNEAGADYVIVYLPRLAYDREPLHRFAREVVPLVS